MSTETHWCDALQRIRGRQPYRCRKCRYRFYASLLAEINGRIGPSNSTHRGASLTRARNRRRLVRRLITIAIFTVMFIIFWLYLRYITTDRLPPDNSKVVRHHSAVHPAWLA